MKIQHDVEGVGINIESDSLGFPISFDRVLYLLC